MIQVLNRPGNHAWSSLLMIQVLNRPGNHAWSSLLMIQVLNRPGNHACSLCKYGYCSCLYLSW